MLLDEDDAAAPTTTTGSRFLPCTPARTQSNGNEKNHADAPAKPPAMGMINGLVLFFLSNDDDDDDDDDMDDVDDNKVCLRPSYM